jgi:hypothetical protein
VAGRRFLRLRAWVMTNYLMEEIDAHLRDRSAECTSSEDYPGKGMGFFGNDIGSEWWPGCTDR